MSCVFHKDKDALFQCYRCRNPICVECESKMDGHSICPRCRREIELQEASRYEAETRDINYTGSVFGGVLAAVGGAIGWSQMAAICRSRWDCAALAVGALVGYGVMRGAGQKRGRALQQIAAVLALVGIVLGYLLVSLRSHWVRHLTLSGSGSAVQGALYGLPGYLAGIGPLGWLLLAAGIVLAYWIPHVRSAPGR
jgi:hypothetical protein